MGATSRFYSTDVNVQKKNQHQAKESKQKDTSREGLPAVHRHRSPSLLGFEDVDSAFGNMDRLANRMMRGPFGLMSNDFFRDLPLFAVGNLDSRTWRPAVDIQEDKAQYTVHAELPGLRKEDVKVELDEGVLTIRGERKLETKEEDKERKYTRVERQYGSFARRFPLPKDVDSANVKASFKEGVLEVCLPRSVEKAKQSEIHID